VVTKYAAGLSTATRATTPTAHRRRRLRGRSVMPASSSEMLMLNVPRITVGILE
jgi:hypothetical protein